MAKRKQTIVEIRGKDTRELYYDLEQARKGLFHARLQLAAEAKPSDIRHLRRTIQRILTVLNERERTTAAAGASAQQSEES